MSKLNLPEGLSEEMAHKIAGVVTAHALAALVAGNKQTQVAIGMLGNDIFDLLGVPDVK